LTLMMLGTTSIMTPPLETMEPVDPAELEQLTSSTIEEEMVEPPQIEPVQNLANSQDTATLAQCIAASGAKFYGAYWCPHCADQKEMFGDAIQYIDYIECDARGENARADVCLANNIQSYPTWIFSDGEWLVGSRSVEELAERAGCL